MVGQSVCIARYFFKASIGVPKLLIQDLRGCGRFLKNGVSISGSEDLNRVSGNFLFDIMFVRTFNMMNCFR